MKFIFFFYIKCNLQQCLSILITKDEGLGNNGIGVSGGLTVDKEEARSEVEQVTLRFIDLARQMEAFFLQKRFLLSALKPELVVKEDINDLRVELARKEDLIKRHYDKITVWQNLLADLQGWAKSPAQGPAPNGKSCKKNIYFDSTINNFNIFRFTKWYSKWTKPTKCQWRWKYNNATTTNITTSTASTTTTIATSSATSNATTTSSATGI